MISGCLECDGVEETVTLCRMFLEISKRPGAEVAKKELLEFQIYQSVLDFHLKKCGTEENQVFSCLYDFVCSEVSNKQFVNVIYAFIFS